MKCKKSFRRELVGRGYNRQIVMRYRFSNCLRFGVVYCLGRLRRTWIGLERVGLVSISLLYNINVYNYMYTCVGFANVSCIRVGLERVSLASTLRSAL
jgi:hypothetical protein